MRTLLVILFCCILAGIFVPGCKRTRPPPLAEQPIDGLLIEYYDDEETIRKSQGIYRYGKLHGLYRIWWPNGQLMSQCDYENALKNGSETLYWSNGKKMSLGTYRGDFKHGVFTNWYSSGAIRSVVTHTAGVRHGPFTAWWESGKKMSEGAYKKGARIGKFTVWNKVGEVVFDDEYEELLLEDIAAARAGELPPNVVIGTPTPADQVEKVLEGGDIFNFE